MVIKGFGSVYTKRHKNKDGSWFVSPALWISFQTPRSLACGVVRYKQP